MRIHFIGIGGIGVSALAKYYLKKGWQVSGSDLVASEITQQMKKLGATIHIGKPKESLVKNNTAKIVFSPAVQKNHVERAAARKKGIPELSYPEALGELTRNHYTIAVSGTHGKSTTTAMLGLLLVKAGLDPTVIVGTKVKEFGNSTHSTSSGLTLSNVEGSNCRVGKSKYLVIEADEYAKSFLHYTPRIMVLTTLEKDHLETYGSLKNILSTFKKYLFALPKDAITIANSDDKNIQQILRSLPNKKGYSLSQKDANKLRKVLKVPGEHNVANALAALAVARYLNIPDQKSYKALKEYRGSWRRFEIFHLKNPVPYTLVSDYGHHPTEVRVTLKAAREKWPKKKIWLVFQPHQYKRTYYLFKEFVAVLSRLPIEKLILTSIYYVAGREDPGIKQKVSAQKLTHALLNTKHCLPNITYIPSFKKVEKYLQENLKGGEVVVVMGAGDIYQNLTLRLTLHLSQKVKG
ncbi:MAG: UDP-N-acetylmuramate--L-alanine ligase [bacterium]|nr:UDP-N-acetylmuramate--L-alanine ligase [bacterium]